MPQPAVDVGAAVSAQRLTKAFGKRTVLASLNLDVESGLAVGLLGANGAGKTTLLKLLLGLIPADSGTGSVLGDRAPELSAETRRRIAYVPQSPGQFAWLSGRAMLKYVAAFYPRFDWDYAHGLIERWKVSTRSPISVLSPGQQQRLSIVRALATRPDLIVLDEPIASLDPATRIAVIDELVNERQTRSMTIVFSSHIVGDLERLCSHLTVLSAGTIAAFDTVGALASLKCVTLDGDEAFLAGADMSAARSVRKPADGQRVLLIPEAAGERLAAQLPPGTRIRVDAPDLDGIVAEWMR